MLDVLIVEDEQDGRDALSSWFEARGFSVRAAADRQQALEAIEAGVPALALLDIRLPDGSGNDLLRKLASTECDVVMVSGRSSVDDAISALRHGAIDFLPKPIDMARLKAIVHNLEQRTNLRNEVRSLRGQLKSLGRFGQMVGASRAMQEVYGCIERVAVTDETVLITGPTGTGKEVTAQTIHELSRRSDKPFVAVNCGAVSATLIESEFFGHERGSFTGADRQRKGVFEQADGGTLFLDEITEMPPDLQVKLLRVLETYRIVRVGGSTEIPVDVRVIAATNRDPHEAVAQGKLRQDLLYRLLVFQIPLPALRDREGDVELLAEHFLAMLNTEYEGEKSFHPRTIERLQRHDWPGNIRELYNAVRRAYVMAPDEIRPEHLPLPLSGEPAAGPRAMPTAGGDLPKDAIVVPVGSSIADMEQRLIELTLEAFEGDKKRAAKTLGISLKTLYSRLQVYAAKLAGTQPTS